VLDGIDIDLGSERSAPAVSAIVVGYQSRNDLEGCLVSVLDQDYPGPVEVVVGNAAVDGAPFRGWFVGHFVRPVDDPRATGAVEVKWGLHPAGDVRDTWGVSTVATWLAILVRGRFRVEFPDREVLLAHEGDYVLVPPGIPHTVRAEEESIVLTVRWPSLPGDSQNVADAAEAKGRESGPGRAD
jgi:cellulose synthase/poly-beta-1,6-N-acetylglucosamine synthase-like glycosyltransferase